MNKKKKIKNIFLYIVTGIVLITVLLVLVIKSKKTDIARVLPIKNSERFCYILESKTDPAAGFDFAFVNLVITDDKSRAEIQLALPNTPIIVGTLKGNYDSNSQRIVGMYHGTIQGVVFNEPRVAQITADGFVFAQDSTELEEIAASQDTSYIIPSASCERFDELQKSFML